MAVFSSESIKLVVGITAVDSLGQFHSVGTAGNGEQLTSGVAEFGDGGCLTDIKILDAGQQMVTYYYVPQGNDAAA